MVGSGSAEHYPESLLSTGTLGRSHFLLAALMLAALGSASGFILNQLRSNIQQFLAFLIRTLSTPEAFCKVQGATVEDFLLVMPLLFRVTFQSLVSLCTCALSLTFSAQTSPRSYPFITPKAQQTTATCSIERAKPTHLPPHLGLLLTYSSRVE